MNSDLKASRSFTRSSRRKAAFSLVEIALSLGIMAFALVSVFGLLPLGLSTFRKASDISAGSQIAQTIIGEAQQADFDALVETHAGSTTAFQKSLRYFDYQGTEQTSAPSKNILYVVNTRIVPSTTIAPGLNGLPATVNPDIATVTVQVATNASNIPLQFDGSYLWVPKTGVPILTFSAYVARSSPPFQPPTP